MEYSRSAREGGSQGAAVGVAIGDIGCRECQGFEMAAVQPKVDRVMFELKG